MRPGHFRWPSDADIPLFLTLLDDSGLGVPGKIPYVSIRRYKESHGGALDGYYWNGTNFVSGPFLFSMVEVDPTNDPGLYAYLFEQSLVGLEIQYLVEYSHPDIPIGVDHETHIITNEVYIPRTVPDPITIGPQSVMGQLELVKDGGTGLFNGNTDSLHFLRSDVIRILGLLHYNAMLDKQQYDSNGQLTYARLRVFDQPGNIPATPGGNETLGLIQEYEVRADYVSVGIVKKFVLKKVL